MLRLWAFDLSSSHGRMLATVLAANTDRHRRIRARADPGAHLLWHRAGEAARQAIGRRAGQRPESDRVAPKVLALTATGRLYRLNSRELGLSETPSPPLLRGANRLRKHLTDIDDNGSRRPCAGRMFLVCSCALMANHKLQYELGRPGAAVSWLVWPWHGASNGRTIAGRRGRHVRSGERRGAH